MIASAKAADGLLGSINAMDHLHFAGRNDVEAAAQLTLANDCLPGAEPHRDHRVAAPDGERREIVWKYRAAHPMKRQCQAAPPGGHKGEKQRARNEGGGPAVQWKTAHLCHAVAAGQQGNPPPTRPVARPYPFPPQLCPEISSPLSAPAPRDPDPNALRVGPVS